MTSGQTIEEFNNECGRDVKALHDAMHAAGYPLTPAEAKFVWVCGWAAMAEMVDLDPAPLLATARKLSRDLPKIDGRPLPARCWAS